MAKVSSLHRLNPRNPRNLDQPASHASGASSLHPPPSRTPSARSSGSIRCPTSKVLRDPKPEEQGSQSSLGLLARPSQLHRRKGSTGTISSVCSSSTDHDIGYSSRLGLSQVRSGHTDAPSTHPSPTNTPVNAGSGIPRPSSAACFSKKTDQRKSLGGVEGQLRGLGTNRLQSQNTEFAPQSQLGSRDMATINTAISNSVGVSPPGPNIMITSPAGVHEGLKSTGSLAGGPGVGGPASGAYEATVEDRQRIYILPRRQNKSLLRLVWLALQDKVIVGPNISHSFPILCPHTTGFVIDSRRSIACPWSFPKLWHNPS